MTATINTVQIPPAGTYRLDLDTSTIAFHVKHMFGMGTVEGSFALGSGKIVVAEPLTASTVTAAASSQTFNSASRKRDAKIKSDKFLHADAHPLIEFSSTELLRTADQWVLRGDITTRGDKAPVEFVVTELHTDPTGITLRSVGIVDRYAHGIRAMKGMVGRKLTLTITAHATRI